jgi:ribosomal protein L37E
LEIFNFGKLKEERGVGKQSWRLQKLRKIPMCGYFDSNEIKKYLKKKKKLSKHTPHELFTP